MSFEEQDMLKLPFLLIRSDISPGFISNILLKALFADTQGGVADKES